MICRGWGTWDFGEAWEPGGGSVGQQEQENPWIKGSQLHPPPPRHEPARHSPPSQLCRPSFTFASASVSAPAAAGARRAARGRAALRDPGGGGGLALGPFLVLLRAPAAFDVSAAARPRGPWRPPLLPPAPPALRHTALPLNPPTVGVGQRRGEPEKGRKGAASPSGQRGSRKRNFSLPPPACGPQPALPHADGNCT